jgi:hypothetical protein
MNTSASTLPHAGQRHDREDAEMQDGEGLTAGQAQTEQASTEHPEPTDSTVAVEVAAVDEDAMDTTLDTDQQLVRPNGTVSQTATSADLLPSPTDDAGRQEVDSNGQTVPVAATHNTVSICTKT